MFQQAADWIGLESRKSLWGQFWSAHQRFFKYLCVAAKVQRLVALARQELARGKVSVRAACPRGVGRHFTEQEGGRQKFPGRPRHRDRGGNLELRPDSPVVCGHWAAVDWGGADP